MFQMNISLLVLLFFPFRLCTKKSKVAVKQEEQSEAIKKQVMIDESKTVETIVSE